MAKRKGSPAGEAAGGKAREAAVDAQAVAAAIAELLEFEVKDAKGEEAWKATHAAILDVESVKEMLAGREAKRATGGGEKTKAGAEGAERKIVVREAEVVEEDDDEEAAAPPPKATKASRGARPPGTTVHGAGGEAAPEKAAAGAPVAPERKVPALEAAGIKPEEVEKLKAEFLATLTEEYRKQFKAEDPAMPDAVLDYNAAALAKKNFEQAWGDFLIAEAVERRNRLTDKAEIPASTGK